MLKPNQNVGLVLHLNDLRIHDNRVLTEAYANCDHVYSVVIIDTDQLARQAFGIQRISAKRVGWYLNAIQDLRHSYRKANGDLIVRIGSTVSCLVELVHQIGATSIFAQAAKTTDEIKLLVSIMQALPNLECRWDWNDTLIDLDTVPFTTEQLPSSFTKFRKHFEHNMAVPEPLEAPSRFSKVLIEPGKIPTLKALGFNTPVMDLRSPIATLKPGESGAWRQLQQYIWVQDCLRTYKQTRNGMTSWSDSSKFSVYFSLGLISPRTVFHEVLKYERARIQNASTYWLRFELLWREFFHTLAFFKGAKLFRLNGMRDRPLTWDRNESRFADWTHGRTGVPIVDAAMIELSSTGYSSNRARQIAASFLVHYLGIDWRWGATWFERHLIDYDPCSNWGNWQYIAGIGTDVRDRMMSMRWQAARYDSEATFVKRWLVHRRSESPAALIEDNPSEPTDGFSRTNRSRVVTQSGHYPA